MSLVAISGNASGTGTLTIAAPNTNNNYTLTLPTNTGTLLSTASAGTVLQVVSAYINSGATSTTSSTFVATALSGSITPTSASSKIYIIFSGGVYQATTPNGFYAIFRNGSNIISQQVQNGIINQWSTQGASFLDSPATTSTLTYAIYMKSGSGTQTYWGGDSPLVNVITMMEIAA
jgi:hypothetical protein